MEISFGELVLPKKGAVVVGVLAEGKLTSSAAGLDKATGGALSRAIANGRFKGKKDQIAELVAPGGVNLSRIVMAGFGKPEELDLAAIQGIGGRVQAQLAGSGEREAFVLLDVPRGVKLDAASLAANLAFGARLRSYRFDKYLTKEKPDEKPSLRKLHILCNGAGKARAAYAPLDKIADGVFFTRDLVSEPANIIYPETLAAQAKTLARLGVTVEVLDEKRMAKLGMGALLGVGQGSAKPPRLVVMQWKGNPRAKDKRPLAFIGKGVTFDTGGISLKPAANMEDMKWDMGGAGVVMGLMKALAGRKAKANVVGVAGLVENMPSGTAQRPGDIVKSMSGQTIEVINTDAEGRLVLADALWYTQSRFKPRFMVNLATLTGAIIIALGHEYAGLFSNNDELAERLIAAGKFVGEPVWRLPLGDEYDKQIKSDAADMKNVGNRAAGSITAAQFLQRFVNGVPWAHLDIAGVTWASKDKPIVPKGGTAFGVRLLERLVAEHYEGK
ncbi:MAG TPA: leucyl aminopeptidase [Alphaproteobacteria bacterium]|nr:leucyl aminopeptidase [Alphaproteobacteria bacterium]